MLVSLPLSHLLPVFPDNGPAGLGGQGGGGDTGSGGGGALGGGRSLGGC